MRNRRAALLLVLKEKELETEHAEKELDVEHEMQTEAEKEHVETELDIGSEKEMGLQTVAETGKERSYDADAVAR